MIEVITFIILLALTYLIIAGIGNINVICFCAGFVVSFIAVRLFYEAKIYKLKKRYLNKIAEIKNVKPLRPIKLPSNVIPFPFRSRDKRK